MSELDKELEFIYTIDRMKSVERMTCIIDAKRHENDAEHSWHVSMMAMLCVKYSNFEVDVDRVIRMLLVHDLVEVYAGDTFAFDENGYLYKHQRELDAAHKLFDGIGDEGRMMFELWTEFEEGITNDSIFANGMDRMQPMLLNLANDGGTWAQHKVPYVKVMKRLEPLKSASSILYDWLKVRIDEYFEVNKC